MGSALRSEPTAATGTHRAAAWLLLLPLVGYVAGFAAFTPQAFSVADESFYVAQAVAFAGGQRFVQGIEPVSGQASMVPASAYPVGTSLLQAPFVHMGDWRAAGWLSVVAVVGTVLILAQWLAEAGHPRALALIFLFYAPTLVFGRLAMSDAPSAAAVTLGLWLFWRGLAARGYWWLAAGFVAGAATLFRESNVLPFVPLLAGVLLRKERGSAALFAGVAAGLALRAASSAWMFGDPWFLKNSGFGFSLRAVGANAPLYAVALMVLLPGGLLAAWRYRGALRPELIAIIVLFFAFYALYDYSGVESGGLKRLLLGPRYFIPVVPLLVFMGASPFMRAVRRVRAATPVRLRRPLAGAALAIAAPFAFAVHPVMAARVSGGTSISDAIAGVPPSGAVLITNVILMQKYIVPGAGPRTIVATSDYGPALVKEMRSHGTSVYVALLDRTGSEFFAEATQENERYAGAVATVCRTTLMHDRWHTPVERLRIWRVGECGAPSASGPPAAPK